jgi:hypothetical protein
MVALLASAEALDAIVDDRSGEAAFGMAGFVWRADRQGSLGLIEVVLALIKAGKVALWL